MIHKVPDKLREMIRRDYSAVDADGRPLLSVEGVAAKHGVHASTVQGAVADLPARKLRAVKSKQPKKLTANQNKIARANAKLAPAVTLNTLIKEFIAKVRAKAPEVSTVEIKLHRTEAYRIEVK